MAIGAGIGGIFGMFTKSRELKEYNKSLEAQAQYNVEKYNMEKALTEFAQMNNQLRANEITTQLSAEATEAQRDIGIQEREAVGAEVVRRGEGLTAGTSVVRSVDKILQQGAKAKAGVETKEEAMVMQVQSQARQANAQKQLGLINSYTNTITQNAQLAASAITGTNAMLQIIGQGLSGAQSGAALGGALGQLGGKVPAGATPVGANPFISDTGPQTSITGTNPFASDTGPQTLI